MWALKALASYCNLPIALARQERRGVCDPCEQVLPAWFSSDVTALFVGSLFHMRPHLLVPHMTALSGYLAHVSSRWRHVFFGELLAADHRFSSDVGSSSTATSPELVRKTVENLPLPLLQCMLTALESTDVKISGDI